MTEHPRTPYNQRFFAAVIESMRGRPPAETIINHHITMVGVERLHSPVELVFSPRLNMPLFSRRTSAPSEAAYSRSSCGDALPVTKRFAADVETRHAVKAKEERNAETP